MNFKLTVLAVIGAFASAPAQAHTCDNEQAPLVTLIEAYSAASGQKFVLDPRVRARVSLIGFEQGEIEYQELISILHVHGFSALSSGDTVYVVPEAAAAGMRSHLGID